MLTKTLARELGPQIRVNCIAPGHIDSKPDKPFSPASRERISKLAPLGRVGTPEDIADVAVFLASDDSRYMTGQTLSVDGGIIMLP
jgi:3-oxoacyl-[acyl-carrier protein] reductase